MVTIVMLPFSCKAALAANRALSQLKVRYDIRTYGQVEPSQPWAVNLLCSSMITRDLDFHIPMAGPKGPCLYYQTRWSSEPELDMSLAPYETLFIGAVPSVHFIRSLARSSSPQSCVVISNSQSACEPLKSIPAVTLVHDPRKSLVDLVNSIW